MDLSSFVLEPAKRIDLIIEFSKYRGQEITLMNNSPAPPDPGTEFIIKFIVEDELTCPDNSTIPEELMPFYEIDPALATKERTMKLDETHGGGKKRLMFTSAS